MQNIKIRGLSKEFSSEAGSILVLDKLDLDINPKSIVSIEGASGSGKSTLLNIIGSMETPTSGQVKYDEQELSQMTAKQKEKLRARNLGFIFQHHYLLPDFTVLENAMMPLLICRNSWSYACQKSESMLEMVGLYERRHHYPSQISGGEMARTGVARALVGNKNLILADEPTGNLDKKNSDHLADLLWKLQIELAFSLIIVTHNRELASRAPYRYQLTLGKLERISE